MTEASESVCAMLFGIYLHFIKFLQLYREWQTVWGGHPEWLLRTMWTDGRRYIIKRPVFDGRMLK